MLSLRHEFQSFLSNVEVDYAGTHLHTFRPLERDALDFLDQWVADKPKQDACSRPVPGDDGEPVRSLVLYGGFELGKGLARYRELDRGGMEPGGVRAIDDFLWLGVGHGRLMYQLSPPAERLADAETTVVRAARKFGEVLARNDPHGRLELEDLTLE